MSIKYILPLTLILSVVGCSRSHTDRIKHQLGSNFNEQVYLEEGGESKSLDRYKKHCEELKKEVRTAGSIKVEYLTSGISNSQLQLATAEIDLANKDCGK